MLQLIHPLPPRPEVYALPGWQFPVPLQRLVIVERVLRALAKHHNGSVPDELTQESDLEVFAGEVGIPLCKADIEPFVVFPHRIYAARSFVQQAYRDLITWCLANNWASDAEADAPAPVKSPAAIPQASYGEPAPQPKKKPPQPAKKKPAASASPISEELAAQVIPPAEATLS